MLLILAIVGVYSGGKVAEHRQRVGQYYTLQEFYQERRFCQMVLGFFAALIGGMLSIAAGVAFSSPAGEFDTWQLLPITSENQQLFILSNDEGGYIYLIDKDGVPVTGQAAEIERTDDERPPTLRIYHTEGNPHWWNWLFATQFRRDYRIVYLPNTYPVGT